MWPGIGYYEAAVPHETHMGTHSCPECAVTMEATTVTAEGVGDLYVETDRDTGLLSGLGIGEQSALDAVLCPECGLTQLSADLSG